MNENNNPNQSDQWPPQDQQAQQQQPTPPQGAQPYGTPQQGTAPYGTPLHGTTPYGAPPAYGMPTYGQDTSVMSTKDWVVTYLVMMIPCVGFIMTLVWAFGQGNLNRRNYARAYLIIMAIMMALVILYVIIMVVALGSAFGTWSSW